MRQRGYPTPADLLAPPSGEDAARAIRVALVAAEWLTKTDLRPSVFKHKHLCIPGKYVMLKHYPVSEIRVEGKKLTGQFDCDLRLGMVVNYDAPNREYEISYIRGYVEGKLPQIYGELIRQLAALQLGSDEYAAEDIGMVASACVGIREQIERERKTI